MNTPEINNNEINTSTKVPDEQELINNGNNKTESNLSSNGDTSGAVSMDSITEIHSDDYSGFNPSIHAANPDGSPRLKASGEFALKRGRGAKSAIAASARGNVAGTGTVGVLEKTTTINLDEAARQSANMIINVCVWTLGDEVGRPFDKSEADGLKLSFRNYYETRGVPEIPPEVGLLMALTSYVAPRLYHEKSKPRLQRIREKLLSLFSNGKK
jgi:hypothetical protein